MSNEEREYQASNLPIPTDEEYEEDAELEEIITSNASAAVAKDLLERKFELRKVALHLEQHGYMTFNDYWRFCEANKILMF